MIAAILSFAPVNFLHPVRVKRLRPLNLGIFLVWCVLGVVALLQQMDSSQIVRIGVGITGVYLFVIGGIMQLFPKLGLKKD